jgi:hypothetical protein
VTLTGANTFNYNDSGLVAYSNGSIALSNVNANGNWWFGAYLMNYAGAGNVTLTGTSVFNDNYYGLIVDSMGNVALNDVTANRNWIGVIIFNTGGAGITIQNLNASENCAGLWFDGDVTVANGTIANNVFGVGQIDPASALNMPGVTFSGNTVDVTDDISECFYEASDGDVVVQSVMLIEAGNQFEFDLSCAHRDSFFIVLPNDDQIQIFCPVSGKALIKRLDNTMLPADLPAGYAYNSAFSLEIFQNQKPIPVILEGGNIKASFHNPSLEAGINYSILYWDNGAWIPLKDFIIDANGDPRVFDLHVGDPRVVLSGLNLVFVNGVPRVEISTNFPGIFVLAQH